MRIIKGGRAGLPAELRTATFTGTVWGDPVLNETDGVTINSVSFAPGARTYWHSHEGGQILIVTSGAGRVYDRRGEGGQITTGDVVFIEPGVEHWHGAGPATAMSHIAIQEKLDGRNVDWMEKVSDEQYGR